MLTTILGANVFGKQATERISVMYDNIKILIDGVQYFTEDGNGNVVEPFIYNGTTYLPVRAIANAFDKDVSWNPEGSIITLNDKGYTFLDSISFYEKDKELLLKSFGSKKWYMSLSDVEHGLHLYYYDASDSNEIDKSVVSYKTDRKYEALQTTIRSLQRGGKLNIYMETTKN